MGIKSLIPIRAKPVINTGSGEEGWKYHEKHHGRKTLAAQKVWTWEGSGNSLCPAPCRREDEMGGA